MTWSRNEIQFCHQRHNNGSLLKTFTNRENKKKVKITPLWYETPGSEVMRNILFQIKSKVKGSVGREKMAKWKGFWQKRTPELCLQFSWAQIIWYPKSCELFCKPGCFLCGCEWLKTPTNNYSRNNWSPFFFLYPRGFYTQKGEE